jgi:hypothetical protein
MAFPTSQYGLQPNLQATENVNIYVLANNGIGGKDNLARVLLTVFHSDNEMCGV